jgi:hypothetical protein
MHVPLPLVESYYNGASKNFQSNFWFCGEKNRLRMKQAGKNSPSHFKNPPADDLHEAIRRRAEEVFIRNGRVTGHDVDNWMQAEKEILQEAAANSARHPAVVINVNGIPFIGEYPTESAEGYAPGEFVAGDTVPVRFEGIYMFVQRPNGQELKTILVKHAN